MCKLSDVRIIKEKLSAFADDCTRSDSTRSIIVAALITNASKSTTNAGVIVTGIHSLPELAMGCSLPPSDMIVRWQGCPHEKAVRLAPRAILRERSDLGVKYEDVERGADGTRAEALEKKLLAFFEAEFPYLNWKHIGNHREKGWRDLEGRDPVTNDRKMLVEVKGRNGRCIARYDKEQA